MQYLIPIFFMEKTKDFAVLYLVILGVFTVTSLFTDWMYGGQRLFL